jgi:3-hydroxy-9,10-secoandrosta-1,3,5(10)-triene-9,17-dione monooxygenase
MTGSPNAPPRDKAAAAQDLVQRARELIPILKDRAIKTEDGRRIPDATLADLKAAQLHNYFTPTRYGGLELDWPVHVDIGRETAKGCGSTAWFATVVLGNTWILGRFPEKAQDEAWGEKPDIVIASAFAGGNQLEPIR